MQRSHPAFTLAIPGRQEANRPLDRMQDPLEGWPGEGRNILRWEEDGGRLKTGDNPTPHERRWTVDLVATAR